MRSEAGRDKAGERSIDGAGPTFAAGESSFRTSLDHLPLAAYTCDTEGHITYVNAKAIELWGRSPKLNSKDDRFCGSFKLYAAKGEPIEHVDCWMAKALTQATGYNGCEIEIERPDGSRVRALAHANPIHNEKGEICGAVNVLVDLTARRQAELVVQSTQQRYQDLVNNLDGIVWEADARTLQILFVSEQARRILGYPVSDWLTIKDFWPSHIHPEDKDKAIAVCREATRRGKGYSFEYRMIAADGRVVWLHDTASLEMKDGQAVTKRGVMVDITQRKQADEKLRQSEERYRAIFEGAPDAMFVLGTQGEEAGRIIAANQLAADSHGYTVEELIGQPITLVDTPEAGAKVPERIRQLMAGMRLNFEVEHVHKNGERFPVEVTAERIMLDGKSYILAFDRDISERKRAEQALRDGQERMRLMVEATKLGLWDWDIARNHVLYSPEWKRQLGYEPHELTDDFAEWESRVHPSDLGPAQVAISAYLAGRTKDHVVEFRMRHLDGSYRWIHARGTAIRNERGEAVRMLGCHVDLTEQKQVEEALRQGKQRLRAVITNTPNVAIQFYDRQGRVKEWNAASELMFGFTAEEAIGRTLDELIHTPEEARQFLDAIAGIEASGQGIGPSEFTFRRRSGETGICLSSIFPIPGDSDGDWFVCMDVDITKQRQAEAQRRTIEAQMQHTQKLESLGVLAGGIAHDFNNLLTPILGRAVLALGKLPYDSPVRPLIQDIESAARRSADLTQQMLAYTGKANVSLAPIRLDTLVKQMAELLRAVVSKKATVSMDLKPVTIEGDAAQIRQIVMNLIINASDALGDNNGVIRIHCDHRRFNADELTSNHFAQPLPEGVYACIEVADTGCGIAPDMLNRIFEPFFTTKFTGRGLGLAAALGIVKGHKGIIQVRSTVNQGTHISVILPCRDHDLPSQAVDAIHRSAAKSGKGSILIVEDEPLVRSYARHVIADAGFEVLVACDGEEGIETFKSCSAQIVAVLLDLTMPKRDGQEVLCEIRKIAPQMPVLIMSGYSESTARAKHTEIKASDFIQKPFTPDHLIHRLHSLLYK